MAREERGDVSGDKGAAAQSRGEGRSVAVKRRFEMEKSARHGDKGGLFPSRASLISLFLCERLQSSSLMKVFSQP